MNVQQMTSSCMEAYFRRAKEQACGKSGVQERKIKGIWRDLSSRSHETTVYWSPAPSLVTEYFLIGASHKGTCVT